MANNAPVPLILTRPQAASEAFLARLPAPLRARLAPVFSPLIRIEHLSPTLSMGPQDGAVFTSANGVNAGPDGLGRTAYCVGPATTAAAQARGWTAGQAGTDADSLVATLQSLHPTTRLFHLSGVHTRGDIAHRLAQAGLRISHVALYDQQLCPLTKAATQVIATAPRVIVPLFSPRTAAHFATSAPRLSSVHAIALSPAVAQELPRAALADLTIAARPDAQAMGDALANTIQRNRL